jgi:hypothetical protein
MSDMFTSFGFGQNDTSISTRVKKFKGEKGVTYRLGFALWPGMEEGQEFTAASMEPGEGQPDEALTPKFLGAPRHYIQGVGYVINKGPEFTQLAGKAPKTMIATLVVVWPLEKGKPTKNSLFSSKPEVLPWVFSMDKYERLKKMHLSGYPMWDWDLSAECEDPQFQKFNFLPAKSNILKEMLKSTNPEGQALAQFVLDRVRALAPNLPREIGMDLTIDQLRERMGQEVASPVGDTAAAGEVDDLIGSMLDD